MGDSEVWISDLPFIEEQWTKPQVFELLGITDDSIKTSNQVQGGFVMIKKSEHSETFIRDWLSLCVRPELIKPLEPDEYHGECIEHREDQSMLSVLSKLRGVKPHRSPTVFPKHSSTLTSKLKTVAKRLIGWKSRSAPWDIAKKIEPVHDDKYAPCIYLHRIGKARSVLSVAYKSVLGMGVIEAIKIFRKERTNE